MAVTTTARLGLTRWSAGTDPFTRAQMDASMAALEANAAMFAQGTLAARPAFGKAGRIYFVTSGASVGMHYYDDGTQWAPIGVDLSSYATTSALTTGLAGKANTSHTHAAADVTSGVFATARLGSGTATTSTWLRGDGAWTALPTQAVSGLTDVTLTSLANGQVLRYNSTTSKWENVSLAQSDVTGLVTALAGKAALVHTHVKADITDFAHSHLIADLPVASSGTSSSTLLVRADDSRLSDARTPTGAASGHLSGSYPSPQVAMVGFNSAGNTTASQPNDYNSGAKWQLKTSAAAAVPDGSTNTWVFGFRLASSSSGGNAYEYAYTDAGNVYRRTGATTTWGAWQAVEKAGVASVFTDDSRLSDARTPASGTTWGGSNTIGSADTDVLALRAFEIESHTRTLTLTRDGSNRVDTLTSKAGATTVAGFTITRDGAGRLATIAVAAGGHTSTITITRDGSNRFSGYTKGYV